MLEAPAIVTGARLQGEAEVNLKDCQEWNAGKL